MREHEAWVHHGAPSIRVRDTYVRDVAGPLLARGADGVVKLDLVLRGLSHLRGEGQVPSVPGEISWAELHDMCRGAKSHLATERALKRRWVNDKLGKLEQARLVRREAASGRRSRLIVLSDRGDGSQFDDPGAVGDQYVTFLGNLVRFDHVGSWNSSALSAYFAAMNAERYARGDQKFAKAEQQGHIAQGGGRWMRPFSWFNDPRVSEGPANSLGRPAEHVRFPFNPRTLRRGMAQLVDASFIAVQSTEIDPRSGRMFAKGRSRNIYYNAFHKADAKRQRRAYYLDRELSANSERRSVVSLLAARHASASSS